MAYPRVGTWFECSADDEERMLAELRRVHQKVTSAPAPGDLDVDGLIETLSQHVGPGYYFGNVPYEPEGQDTWGFYPQVFPDSGKEY